MKHALSILLLSISLCACAGSSTDASAGEQEDPVRAALPDHSDQVEKIQGEDPRRYFVANLRALNAVDKDGNGLWDDAETALSDALAAAPLELQSVDRRPLLQVIRSYQASMQFLTSAEAKADRVPLVAYARTCLRALVATNAIPRFVVVNGKNYESKEYLITLATEAVISSKERVLAARYSDGLRSGGTFGLPVGAEDGLAACAK